MDASADTEAQDSQSADDLGVKLKRAREAQGLSLDEIAAELRISEDHLRALEQSRFDSLGAPVFAKGYLKQYGARLGLDAQALAADFDRAQGDSGFEISPSPSIRLRDERQITIWIASGLVILVLAAGLALWWFWQQNDDATDAVNGVPESPEAATDAPEPDSTVIAANLRRAEIQPAIEETEAIEARDQLAVPTEAPIAAQGPIFEVLFLEDSWTEISDLGGERLFYDLGRAGERVRLPADRGLSIFFGNGTGVELHLDEEPFAIPATARRGDFAEFDLEPITN